MLKKRVIFTLLLEDQNFVLSRNFRLQSFGNIQTLMQRYNFSKIAFSIDEIIIIDVSRKEKTLVDFRNHIKKINQTCFIPIGAGGGIRDFSQTKKILNSGADKVIINSILYEDPDLVFEIAESYGSQSIIASIDFKRNSNNYDVYINNGEKKIIDNFSSWINKVSKLPIGEIYLNSMDNDGTGNGYLFEILDLIPSEFNIPIIIAGGAGNYKHFELGLNHNKVDAVATANLFNFVGDGFINARKQLISKNYNVTKWKEL